MIVWTSLLLCQQVISFSVSPRLFGFGQACNKHETKASINRRYFNLWPQQQHVGAAALFENKAQQLHGQQLLYSSQSSNEHGDHSNSTWNWRSLSKKRRRNRGMVDEDYYLRLYERDEAKQAQEAKRDAQEHAKAKAIKSQIEYETARDMGIHLFNRWKEEAGENRQHYKSIMRKEMLHLQASSLAQEAVQNTLLLLNQQEVTTNIVKKIEQLNEGIFDPNDDIINANAILEDDVRFETAKQFFVRLLIKLEEMEEEAKEAARQFVEQQMMNELSSTNTTQAQRFNHEMRTRHLKRRKQFQKLALCNPRNNKEHIIREIDWAPFSTLDILGLVRTRGNIPPDDNDELLKHQQEKTGLDRKTIIAQAELSLSQPLF